MTDPPGAIRPDAFVCPRCHGPLTTTANRGAATCSADSLTFRRAGGIWRFLLPTDQDRIAPLCTQYRTVRAAEGWGSDDDAYYRQLPRVPTDDPHEAIWRIRARSEQMLYRRVIKDRRASIVDLGAGNGWLAHRLGQRGHAVAAVDLDDDDRDGLGTWSRYAEPSAPTPFIPVQATFDRLPWPDAIFDVALFNGALHYSADYATTLAEACRVVRPGGTVAILDSPFYHREASGHTMVAERTARFRDDHGPHCGAVANEGFLTLDRLRILGRDLGLTWQIAKPYYGLRWALRPLQNRLLGRREPARFWVVWASVGATRGNLPHA